MAAIPRPNWSGGNRDDLMLWMEDELKRNPGYQLPRGYRRNADGSVSHPTDLSQKIGKGAAIAGMGIMAYGGGQLLAPAFAGGGAAGAGTGTTAGTGAGTTAAGGTGVATTASRIRDWLGIAKDVSGVLGEAAGSRAQAQNNSESAELTRNRLELDRAKAEDQSYMDRADIDLARQRFETEAPAARYGTGMRAALGANAPGVSVGTGAPITMSSGRSVTPIHYGGLSPGEAFGAQGRELSNITVQQMIEKQLAGDKFEAIPEVEFPSPSAAPEESTLDRLLGYGALGTGIAGALAGRRRNTRTQMPDDKPEDEVNLND